MRHKKHDIRYKEQNVSLSSRAQNLKTAARMEENVGEKTPQKASSCEIKHDQTCMMWKYIIGD